MSVWEALVIALAGLGAGTINTVVGSGTLITFPVLLALGYPPVVANVSNNIGLVPGAVTGAWGYRRELVGQQAAIRRLAPASAVGGAVGAILLLRLPETAFEAIVPALIALALVLVVVQPALARRLAARRARDGSDEDGNGSSSSATTTAGGSGGPGPGVRPGPVTVAGVFGAGIYGGYFGAAQGVLLVGLLGSLLPEPLQRVNALKNVLSAVVNAVASVTFLIVRPEAVDPAVVALIAAGSICGGFVGAGIGRRLPQPVLRTVIVVVGVVAITRLLTA